VNQYGDVQILPQKIYGTCMVKMSMCQEDFFNLPMFFMDNGENILSLCAGVNEETMLALFID
jgi:hypothetical protein